MIKPSLKTIQKMRKNVKVESTNGFFDAEYVRAGVGVNFLVGETTVKLDLFKKSFYRIKCFNGNIQVF